MIDSVSRIVPVLFETAQTCFAGRRAKGAAMACLLMASVGSAGLLGGRASAAVLTWDSSGANPASPVDGSGTWDTATANWSDGTTDAAWVSPVGGDIAVLGSGGTGAATVSVNGIVTAKGLQFNSGASYTISLAGNTTTTNELVVGSSGITVADNVTVLLAGSAASATAAYDMSVGGSQTWNVGNNSTLEVKARFTKTATSTITKSGNGVLILDGTNGGSSAVTGITYAVNQGILRIQGTNLAWGNSALGFTVASGAAVEMNGVNLNQTGATISLNGTGVSNGGALRVTSGSISFGTGAGVVTLASASTGIGVDSGAQFTVSHVLSGASGGLTKVGGGKLILGAANTYAGATTVAAGTLMLNATGSAANSTGFDVQPGATLDITSASGFAITASQTLSGGGSVLGAVNVNGVLSPGEAGIGTLTLNNSLTLGGISRFQIDKTGSVLSQDLVTGITTLTEGGVLNVSFLNSGGTPLAAGDSFQLFNASTFAGAFSSVSLPALDASLTWDTSGLAGTGTITVAANSAVPEPASLGVLVVGGLALLGRRRSR